MAAREQRGSGDERWQDRWGPGRPGRCRGRARSTALPGRPRPLLGPGAELLPLACPVGRDSLPLWRLLADQTDLPAGALPGRCRRLHARGHGPYRGQVRSRQAAGRNPLAGGSRRRDRAADGLCWPCAHERAGSRGDPGRTCRLAAGPRGPRLSGGRRDAGRGPPRRRRHDGRPGLPGGHARSDRARPVARHPGGLVAPRLARRAGGRLPRRADHSQSHRPAGGPQRRGAGRLAGRHGNGGGAGQRGAQDLRSRPQGAALASRGQRAGNPRGAGDLRFRALPFRQQLPGRQPGRLLQDHHRRLSAGDASPRGRHRRGVVPRQRRAPLQGGAPALQGRSDERSRRAERGRGITGQLSRKQG